MTFRLAAPSCVLADRVGPNCQALASLVSEVGLMLLETEACLAYDQTDLPATLARLSLSYHAHLPVDLPWDQGVPSVAAKIRALADKIAFLRPHGYVLHPPPAGALPLLLAHAPELGGLVCLENTAGSDLAALWPDIEALDLGVCLDLGHLVSYGQESIFELPGIFERVRFMHVYGQETPTGHAGLEHLPNPELLHQILGRVRPDCVLVVEVFDWAQWTDSLALLKKWLHRWGMAYEGAGSPSLQILQEWGQGRPLQGAGIPAIRANNGNTERL